VADQRSGLAGGAPYGEAAMINFDS